MYTHKVRDQHRSSHDPIWSDGFTGSPRKACPCTMPNILESSPGYLKISSIPGYLTVGAQIEPNLSSNRSPGWLNQTHALVGLSAKWYLVYTSTRLLGCCNNAPQRNINVAKSVIAVVFCFFVFSLAMSIFPHSNNAI